MKGSSGLFQDAVSQEGAAVKGSDAQLWGWLDAPPERNS